MKLHTEFMERTLSRVSPVVAVMAHTDGTRVMQYQPDDQNSIKTTNMQMAMDYLEIPEPTPPWGFLKLAEEARNVKVESGRSCYTEEVQSQEAGMTKPVLVTFVKYSSPKLRKGAAIAAGISTEMVPTNISAGRREPVDQLGLVGPQNKTEQSVLPSSDADDVGTVPTARFAQMSQLTKFSQWPVGLSITCRPVGPDRTFSTCDADRPVGPERTFSTCDLDRPVADGPVGQSFIYVGPVGQPFTTGPVGTHEMVSNCKLMDRIADSPVGSTEIHDPAEETEIPIQTDFTSWGDTPPPPLGDSGVHRFGRTVGQY